MDKSGKKTTKKEINPELVRLGNRIKALRIKKGYTSYEFFAYDNKISRTQYGRYERGEDLRYMSLIKIIKALDVSIEEFFSEGFEGFEFLNEDKKD